MAMNRVSQGVKRVLIINLFSFDNEENADGGFLVPTSEDFRDYFMG
jgi:hypothetical protein